MLKRKKRQVPTDFMKMNYTPHVIRMYNPDQLSGLDYLVTQHDCKNCGAGFTLWYYQQKCPYCQTKYKPETTSWCCY